LNQPLPSKKPVDAEIHTDTTKVGEAEEIFDTQNALNLIEAALYVAGHPLELKTLCSITGVTSKKKIQSLARIIAEEYKKKNGALEIVELEDGRFVMQLKPQYVARVKRLSMKPLLTEGPLRTLSYIAYKQPVPQAKVVLVRGAQAYQHVAQLLEMGLISRERFGKSQLLRTTDLFADYFNLSHDLRLMKRQLDAIFSQISETKKK
jgi:segregation and condensation protein B